MGNKPKIFFPDGTYIYRSDYNEFTQLYSINSYPSSINLQSLCTRHSHTFHGYHLNDPITVPTIFGVSYYATFKRADYHSSSSTPSHIVVSLPEPPLRNFSHSYINVNNTVLPAHNKFFTIPTAYIDWSKFISKEG